MYIFIYLYIYIYIVTHIYMNTCIHVFTIYVQVAAAADHLCEKDEEIAAAVVVAAAGEGLIDS